MKREKPASQITVGRILGSFGLRGETKIATSDPANFRPGLTLIARLADGSDRELSVASVRPHKNRVLARFTHVDDRSAAQALHGATLLAKREDLPALPEATYRDEDLVGMKVVDARLGDLGAVSGVLHYPHADVLVVGEREMLVPMHKAYEIVVDVESHEITSRLPEGFEDLAR